MFGVEKIAAEHLVIPHPRLVERAFTLVPLIELDADVVIPGYGRADSYLAGVAGQRIEKVATCQCPLAGARQATALEPPCGASKPATG